MNLKNQQHLNNTNLYEVVITQTETKLGKMHVYAKSEEEAQEIVSKEMTYYFETLEDTKETSTIDYKLEMDSVNKSDKQISNYEVTYIDESNNLYKKEYLPVSQIKEMCDSIDGMKANLNRILKARFINEELLAEILIDIMDLTSDIKCELDENDKYSKENINKKIEEMQDRVEEFLKEVIL